MAYSLLTNTGDFRYYFNMSTEGTPQKDSDFFKNLEEQMEGSAPGLSKRIERLDFEQLGRAIVIKGENKGQDEIAKIESAITRAQSLLQGKPSNPQDQPPPEESKDYLIGYILPVQADQRRHVVIFKTGSILIIEPPTGMKYLSSESESEDKYKRDFSPNEDPLTLSREWGKNALEVENRYFKEGIVHTVLSNKNPNDLPKISEAMSQALSFANELKVSREIAKQESLRDLIRKLDLFFGNGEPNGPPQDQNLPPAPPTSDQP